MIITHEGEILLKEKYGSTSKERFYIKPPEQGNIVILDEKKSNGLCSWFTKIFLPQGYPDSVSNDYVAYQIWDTAQAFCSTITGILATQEVLRGVGVGDTNATPLAATIMWVIKDGCGHIGKILFAFTHGTYLDAYSKKWRLYADTLNDAAMGIEIALPLFKNYTTFVLCVSTVMKAIVGVAGGATRAAMTQHHAVRGNLADVSAKDSAQETAVNLIASFTALLIMSLFGNSITIFIFMMILHIVFNYFAVRAVCLKTLNEPRFLQLIELYLKKEVIATHCEINQKEPIIFYQMGSNLLDLKMCGFQIKLGSSINKLIKQYPKAIHVKKINEIYEGRHYILLPNVQNRIMHVLLKEDANTDDILHAYFHAVLFSITVCAINDIPLAIYEASGDVRPFVEVCHTLQTAAWTREPIENPSGFTLFSYQPSYDLMKYVDKIVQKEWDQVRAGMIHTGWDLSKHLLMTDEWRVSAGKLNPPRISAEKTLTPVVEQASTQMEPIVEPEPKIIPFDELLEDFVTDSMNKEQSCTIEPETSQGKSTESSKLKTQTATLEPDNKESQEPIEGTSQPAPKKLPLDQQIALE